MHIEVNIIFIMDICLVLHVESIGVIQIIGLIPDLAVHPEMHLDFKT